LVLLSVSQRWPWPPQLQRRSDATDNYVTEKSFKSKVFEVKYRDSVSLANVLSRLTSGFKGAAISIE
jgi:hypothetical protein